MPNQTGKRYVCAVCASEMLVTRGGDGMLTCCGQEMALRGAAAGSAKATPAAGAGTSAEGSRADPAR